MNQTFHQQRRNQRKIKLWEEIQPLIEQGFKTCDILKQTNINYKLFYSLCKENGGKCEFSTCRDTPREEKRESEEKFEVEERLVKPTVERGEYNDTLLARREEYFESRRENKSDTVRALLGSNSNKLDSIINGSRTGRAGLSAYGGQAYKAGSSD